MVSTNCDSDWGRRKSSYDIEIGLVALSVFIAIITNSLLEIIKIEWPQIALNVNIGLLIIAIAIGFWWHNELLKKYDIHEYRLTTEILGTNTDKKLEKIPKIYNNIKKSFEEFPTISIDLDPEFNFNPRKKAGFISKLKKGFSPVQPIDESELRSKENQLGEKSKSLNDLKIIFFNEGDYEKYGYADIIAYVFFDVARNYDKVSIICSCNRSKSGISIRNRLDKIFSNMDFLATIDRNFE